MIAAVVVVWHTNILCFQLSPSDSVMVHALFCYYQLHFRNTVSWDTHKPSMKAVDASTVKCEHKDSGNRWDLKTYTCTCISGEKMHLLNDNHFLLMSIIFAIHLSDLTNTEVANFSCGIIWWYEIINTLAPGKWSCNNKLVIFKLVSRIHILNISCEIALRSVPQGLTDVKSVLVKVMAWGHQATSHFSEHTMTQICVAT